MPSNDWREEFSRTGLVRLPGAIAMPAVEEMLSEIWASLRDKYHIHREAPGTWPEPKKRVARVEQIGGANRFLGTHHLSRPVTFEQVGSPAICDALDLLMGTGQWQRPARWGSLLVTFPESTGRWDVPTRNWHLDLPVSHRSSQFPATRIFTCLAKLPPQGGGTLFVSGSHRLLLNLAREGEQLSSPEARKRLLHAYPWFRALCSHDEAPDRVERFMANAATIDGVEVRVVEMTAEPGDVLLAHPMLLHAPALNCSAVPRFALSATVFRAGTTPVKLYP